MIKSHKGKYIVLNRVKKIDDLISIRNIIVSVSDKTGLDILIPELIKINSKMHIYSTGGTYKKIKDILGSKSDKNLSSVTEYTGQPEMQGGLVKTLDFKIYLGLLSESYNSAHNTDISRVNGVNFDMVIVNLYPFSETINQTGINIEDARANIDIGGPCMLRAAAKNYLRVASVCSHEDYMAIINEMKSNNGMLSLITRFKCAQKAFSHTAEYDSTIFSYLTEKNSDEILKTYNSE